MAASILFTVVPFCMQAPSADRSATVDVVANDMARAVGEAEVSPAVDGVTSFSPSFSSTVAAVVADGGFTAFLCLAFSRHTAARGSFNAASFSATMTGSLKYLLRVSLRVLSDGPQNYKGV